MTHRMFKTAALALGAVALGAVAIAQSEVPPAVEARQGQFQIMALNVGVLANMARGNTDYDAELASIAANNLVAISMLDQTVHWPEGTDSDSIEGTRALPAIWENLPDVVAKWDAFGAAAEGLAAVAGDGLEAVQASIGPVGATCGDCHDTYRAPE